MSLSEGAAFQDKFPLLHLLDLVSREPLLSNISRTQSPLTVTEPLVPNACVIGRCLHPDDATILAMLKPEDVQGWCLSRIADYQALIAAVRAQPSLALYNASLHEFVVRHRSNMRALRSVYNNASPIHRRLPPEILLEVFANLHHDGSLHGPPALRVCHYWHALLQRTPQLWQSLLVQESLVKWDPQWKANRFAAAVSRSAPLDLSLHLRGIDRATVNALTPSSQRITSMTFLSAGYSDEFDALDRFLDLDMPRLRCLDICRWTFSSKIVDTLPARFFVFPRLQTLRLRCMYLGPPEVPHTFLRHLELSDCWESFEPRPDASHPILFPLSVDTLLAVIRSCPYLETLRIDGTLPGNTWPHSGPLVNASRMRHLTFQCRPFESTLTLLSRLVLPVTTALDLEPVIAQADQPLRLSTSVVTPHDRPPVAEVTLHLMSTLAKNTATWEAKGDESRPLRVSVTHFNDCCLPDTILGRTNDILAIFTPGTAVTSLTIISGRSFRPEDFWTGLLTALPHLVRLVVDAGRGGDYPRILPLLAKPQGGEGFLCPSLTDLSVLWDPKNDPIEWIGLAALEGLQATASASVRPGSEPWTTAAGTLEYCRVVQRCLRDRADHGCLPLRAISVSIWNRGYGTEVEVGLREGLKDLVEEVSVGFQSKQGW